MQLQEITNDYVYLSQTAIMWQELLLLDYIKLKEGLSQAHARTSTQSHVDHEFNGIEPRQPVLHKVISDRGRRGYDHRETPLQSHLIATPWLFRWKAPSCARLHKQCAKSVGVMQEKWCVSMQNARVLFYPRAKASWRIVHELSCLSRFYGRRLQHPLLITACIPIIFCCHS